MLVYDIVLLFTDDRRLEGSTKVFANIFSYLEDKGLQGELWGREAYYVLKLII